jgi:hypothetical protein
LLVGRGLFREYESGVEIVHGLFEKPMTHGYPKDDHLRRERLNRKRENTVRIAFFLSVLTTVSTESEDSDSTQNVVQT